MRQRNDNSCKQKLREFKEYIDRTIDLQVSGYETPVFALVQDLSEIDSQPADQVVNKCIK